MKSACTFVLDPAARPRADTGTARPFHATNTSFARFEVRLPRRSIAVCRHTNIHTAVNMRIPPNENNAQLVPTCAASNHAESGVLNLVVLQRRKHLIEAAAARGIHHYPRRLRLHRRHNPAIHTRSHQRWLGVEPEEAIPSAPACLIVRIPNRSPPLLKRHAKASTGSTNGGVSAGIRSRVTLGNDISALWDNGVVFC